MLLAVIDMHVVGATAAAMRSEAHGRTPSSMWQERTVTPPAARAALLVRGTAANPFLSLALRTGRMPCLAQLQKLDISGARPIAQNLLMLHCLQRSCQHILPAHSARGAHMPARMRAERARARALA